MNRRVMGPLLYLGIVVAFLGSLLYFMKAPKETTSFEVKSSAAELLKPKSVTESGLPDVKSSDWDLVLVNRDNEKPELNPDLALVENVPVDARIAENVSEFLAAARSLDPSQALVSGYRSVALQAELYESYVQKEMASGLSREEAEKQVQTYSQPAGASEHQTGLAIDMSSMQGLNQMDPTLVEKIKNLAPDYGFVLRFSADTTAETGIGYEDWHYRYVGKASARYMTDHELSLERYLALLKEKGQ